MSTVEKVVLSAFVLIGIYLVLQSENASKVINSLASGSSNIFATLQGRTVDQTGIQAIG